MSKIFGPTERLARWALVSTALTGLSTVVFTGTAAQAQSASLFEKTPEYYASRALEQINAAAAYNLGFTGKGVTIGILDTGLDARNSEFAAAGKLFRGYDYNTDTAITVGQNGENDAKASHGTFIAGIAAGSRDGVGIMGVAFDSGLYVTTPYAANAKAWDAMVAAGVPVINNSFGVNDCGADTVVKTAKCSIADYSVAEAVALDPEVLKSGRAAVQAGTLLVFATGNETQANPDYWAGLPYRVADLQRGWLAVGSVDANNNRSWFSNACGVAAQWCLVAPGELYSSVTVGLGENGGNYKSGQGTSYATPVVVGVAALVKQAFPWFTNYDLQQALLTTATPLGTRTAGSIVADDVYGWGLVNAGAAVKGYGGFVTVTTLDTKGYSSTFGNDLYGPGGLIKTGAGTLTLAGNNSYTGTTTVDGGALAVTGSIVSQVTVGQGGSFGGSGRVGSTVVNGTLGLGTPQTLTINGNLTFGSTGVYLASIQGATADRVNVDGTAALAGTLRPQTLGGSYRFYSPYTILSSTGGVSGTFGTFDRSLVGAGIVTKATYTGTSVQLSLAPGSLAALAENPTSAEIVKTTTSGNTTTSSVTAPDVAMPKSDRVRMAMAIDKAVAAGADASPLFNLYNATDDDLDSDLDQLTGEAHSTVGKMGVQISSQFLGAMSDVQGEGRGASASAPMGYASTPKNAAKGAIDKATNSAVPTYGPKYSVWGGVISSYGTTSGDAEIGSSRATTRATQMIGGLDIRLDPATLVGFALAGGSANGALAGGLGAASANTMQAGTYASVRSGALSLTGAAAFSWMDVTTHRAIPVLGYDDVTAKYQPTLWSGRIEAAFEVAKFANVGVSPYAAFEAQSMRTPGFVEKDAYTGAAALGGLTASAQTTTTTRSIVGLDLRGSVDVQGVTVRGFARAGWAHYFDQSAETSAYLTGITGSDFAVTGALAQPDAAIVAFGLNTKVMDNVTLLTSFDGEFAGNSQKYTGSARVKVSF